jgi:Subtilase family
MGWTRKSGRDARDRRRPCLETLETRQLLSASTAKPASAPVLNADGSTNFDRIIQASAARSTFNVDGSGETVAVIDTGADWQNPTLGGAIGPGNKVLTGVDFTGSANGVLPSWQHGTGVAGLIAGSSPTYSGVAPGASIIPLRVFGDNNQGSFQQIEEALNWVVQNHSQYNITAVNLSVSDGNNYLSNQFANDGGVGQQITSSINQLESLDIPVVVAAGNSLSGNSQGMGFPAIVPGVISVTATDASDQLASNAQRLGAAKGGASATTIAAPGIGITAPSGDSGFTTEDGTSFATPQVTGTILLLQQMYEKAYHTLPSIPELDQLLQQGAVAVHDSVTGINIGRLDVLNSATILNQQINAANANSANNGASTSNPGSTTPPTQAAIATPTPTPAPAPTPPPAAAPAPAPAPVPETQVFVNGVSIGNYSTAALAAKYPSLFAFLKGPVASLRIWVAPGATVDLGPSMPSSSKGAPVKIAKHHVATSKVHATSVSKAVPVVHHPAKHKAAKSSNSLLSYLFPFKL